MGLGPGAGLKINLVLIAVALSSLSAASVAHATTEPTGQVSGTITDAETGDPISGASADLFVGATEADPSGLLWLATTSASGEYLHTEVPSGPAMISIQIQGYASFQAFVTVVGGDELVVNAMLDPVSTGGVSGRVVDASSGEPIRSAFVQVLVGATPENPSGGFLALAESGPDGTYLIQNLEVGSALLTVDASGFERYEAFVELVADDVVVIDVALEVVGTSTTTESPSSLPLTGGEQPWLRVLLASSVAIFLGISLVLGSVQQSPPRS